MYEAINYSRAILDKENFIAAIFLNECDCKVFSRFLNQK